MTPGKDFESLRYDVEEMWPDTQKAEGGDGGYRLATAEDSDNHESPVGERVGFSESPKGKHPDPEKEIGARRIQRNTLLLEALSMLREAALREKQRWARTIDYFCGKVAKISIMGKWRMAFFCVPKQEYSSGRHTSQQAQGQGELQQKVLQGIYPVKITSLSWNWRWYLVKK